VVKLASSLVDGRDPRELGRELDHQKQALQRVLQQPGLTVGKQTLMDALGGNTPGALASTRFAPTFASVPRGQVERALVDVDSAEREVELVGGAAATQPRDAQLMAATNAAAQARRAVQQLFQSASARVTNDPASTSASSKEAVAPTATTTHGGLITASVGRGGENHPADVEAVQRALVAKGFHVTIDRDAGPRTFNAIRQFQEGFLREPDGRVDVGGLTERRLGGSSSEATHTEPRSKEGGGGAAGTSRFDTERALRKARGDNAGANQCAKGVANVLEDQHFPCRRDNACEWWKHLPALGWERTSHSPESAPAGAVLVYKNNPQVGKPIVKPHGGQRYGHVEVVGIDQHGSRWYISDKARHSWGGSVPSNFAGAFVFKR
jgi:peptidoglycan hydrolase-like protein with peptidoglycan-binding domain